MSKQLTISDYERDVLREVVRTLEACKKANKSAYTNNVFWKMGYDTAYQCIVHEIQKGERDGVQQDSDRNH